ncbi:MAG: copper amine oxidase N-terminal domain-containing protein [Defluviitaleaceae bacterium]|nr:copper amine oxidase N-terminal domain-containing protein [Defluviitaleaceae bacterium]
MKKPNKIFKKICKSFAVMGVGLVMVVSAVQTTHASGEDFAEGITNRNAPPRRGAIGLTISGQLPRAVTGNRAFDEELNARFTAQFNDFVEEHAGRAASLEFSNNVFVSGDFVSVVINMTAISATTTRARATTVINAETNEIISLSDYNPNALAMINNRLNNMVAESPRLFVANFSGIDNNHPFYINGSILVIPFASGTFALGNREIHTEGFSIISIHNETIEDNLFVTMDEEQYNTIMVRLGEVVRLFGFTAEWDADAGVTTIIQGNRTTEVVVGENTHGLELPPEIISGHVHVPLSFFRDVMGIATTVMPSGEILMTLYQNFEQ